MVLYYHEMMTNQEIALTLDIAEADASALLARARHRLRESMLQAKKLAEPGGAVKQARKRTLHGPDGKDDFAD